MIKSKVLTSRHMRAVIAALLLAVAMPVLAVEEADLLPVDAAFALRAEAPQRGRIELTWRIAEGYYLYRHRIAVQPADSAFKFNPLQLPPGEKHTDEFFGKVETYRDALTAVLTGAAATDVDAVTLRVKYQGCADAGVCYPPRTRTLKVVLPAAQAEASLSPQLTPARGRGGLDEDASASAGVLDGPAGRPLLGTSPGGNGALPLPPERAFGFEAIADGGNALLLRFTPARGYYLYRDKTSLLLRAGPGIAAQLPPADRWPKGTPHRDEYFGATTVYFDEFELRVPVSRTHPRAVDAQLTVGFQGCQADGICYPPMTRQVQLQLPIGTVTPAAAPDTRAAAVAASSTDIAAGAGAVATIPSGSTRNGVAAAPTARYAQSTISASAPLPLADDSRLAAALSGPHRLWTLLLFFGFGLLLAFTPCVLPMIPILSGLIAGGGPVGTRRALLLSSVYVLASAAVFTVAGVAAGLLGANLQAAFQKPWLIIAFAGIFVALALAMFGLYDLSLTGRLRSGVDAISRRLRGGSLSGVAAMGALSALIVGPCIAPPLAAAVLYIGQTRDPWFGGAALFLLGLGMGAPLLAFGVAAGRGLPTSGPWMGVMMRAFGFVFLGMAVWMLARLLPAPVVLALWGLLGVSAAVWLWSAARASLPARVLAVLLGVIGAAELFGALAGGQDPLQPLAGLRGGGHSTQPAFDMIKSAADLDRALAAATAAGRPLLLDFYADWCVSCKEMERYTFTDPVVQRAMGGFVLLKADVTANDATDQALMRRLGIIGPPATLVFRDGRERRELRLIGYERAAPFATRLARAAAPD